MLIAVIVFLSVLVPIIDGADYISFTVIKEVTGITYGKAPVILGVIHKIKIKPYM